VPCSTLFFAPFREPLRLHLNQFHLCHPQLSRNPCCKPIFDSANLPEFSAALEVRGLQNEGVVEVHVPINAVGFDALLSRLPQFVKPDAVLARFDHLHQLVPEGFVLSIVYVALKDAELHALPVCLAEFRHMPQSAATLAGFRAHIVTDQNIHAQTFGMNGG
jgi:hypothetical protein